MAKGNGRSKSPGGSAGSGVSRAAPAAPMAKPPMPAQTLEVLERKEQTIPNQVGSRVEQADGRTVYRADITQVAPVRHQPSSKQVADPGLAGSRPARGGGSNG